MPIFCFWKQGFRVEESILLKFPMRYACTHFCHKIYGTLKKKEEVDLCALHHPHKQKSYTKIDCQVLKMQNWCKYISLCCHRMGWKNMSSKHHLYQKGGELWGYCSQLAQSSGKGVRLIRAGYLCRLPSPPDCHSILDVKNRQKLIIASVFKDAHTCSLQTRERGKKSILSGQVSVLSLSYLHTPTNLPMWEQDYRCTVCRVNSSSPLWELIRRDAWIALFSQAHGVQPIFISSLKEGKAETS